MSITLNIPTDLDPQPSRAQIISYVTGHGQGNAENCAEFCPKNHWFAVDGHKLMKQIWRDDCRTTAAPNQAGTWQYPRAGWCPGAIVYPWNEEFLLGTTKEITIDYGVEEYVNTCRPDSENCSGCVFGSGCDYNGGDHTEPSYLVSALLILFQ